MTIIIGIVGFVLFTSSLVFAACVLSSYLSHRERQRRLREWVGPKDEDLALWKDAVEEMEQAEAKRWGK